MTDRPGRRNAARPDAPPLPAAGLRVMSPDKHAMYRAVFEASRDAVLILQNNRVIDCNAAAVKIFAMDSKERMLGTSPTDFSPATQPGGTPSETLARQHIEAALDSGSALFEWVHQTLRGEAFLAEVLLSRVDTGEDVLLQAVVRDIAARRRIEEELKTSNEQAEHFRTLVEDAIDQSGIGLLILDDQFRAVWISQPIGEFFGLATDKLIGSDGGWLFETYVRPRLERGRTFVATMRRAYRTHAQLEAQVCHVLGTDGVKERWLEHQSYPITNGIYAGGRIDIFRDLTERKLLEDELAHRATHDYLTGLINRQQFEALLDHQISRALHEEIPFSLIMFDVDRFKTVNDELGHEVGDRALEAIASVSRQCIRTADSLARWGGEEFMVLLPGCGADNAFQTAETLRTRILGDKFHPRIRRLSISAGTTQYQPGENRRDVLKRVDDALYEAKQKGRNRVVSRC